MGCIIITTKAAQQRLPPDPLRFAPLSNERSKLAHLFSAGVFYGWCLRAGEAERSPTFGY